MVNIILAIVSLIFSIISFVFSIFVFIRLVGRENSTHTIQYVPLSEELERGKVLKKELDNYEHDDLEL